MTATPRRGRLLFVAPVMPADRGNGLAMRVGFFLDAYSRSFDIDLAVFPIAGSAGDSCAFAESKAQRMRSFPRPARNSHFALVAAVRDPSERLAAFRRYGRPSITSFDQSAVCQALEDWIDGRTYDVVHVSRTYLAFLVHPCLIGTRQPHIVVDCDEDDARTHRYIAALERRRRRILQADWADAEADAFAALARAVPHVDLAFAASAAEATALSRISPNVVVIPNVAPRILRRGHPRRRKKERTLLYVGTMGYAPNDDGARWLLTRIWPRLRPHIRGPSRLLIVGSNPSPALVQLGRRNGASVTGAVPDIEVFYREADLALIPIRAGGGTRIKLLEAVAYGVAVVSTTFGAEGTTFRHRQDLLIADSEREFTRACVEMLRRPRYARVLAAHARRRAAQDYSSHRWAERLAVCVSDLVRPQASDAERDGLSKV